MKAQHLPIDLLDVIDSQLTIFPVQGFDDSSFDQREATGRAVSPYKPRTPSLVEVDVELRFVLLHGINTAHNVNVVAEHPNHVLGFPSQISIELKEMGSLGVEELANQNVPRQVEIGVRANEGDLRTNPLVLENLRRPVHRKAEVVPHLRIEGGDGEENASQPARTSRRRRSPQAQAS